jgi:ComF family protein
LIRLKYRPNMPLARELSAMMIRSLEGSDWQPSLVLPVPLHRSRALQRGFNQARLLAKTLAGQLGVPLGASGLVRLRDTPSQVGLNMRQRKQNMSLAFKAKGDIVEGNTVLLVDDLRTTGATLADCARSLREAGALRVYATTVAQAGSMHSHD